MDLELAKFHRKLIENAEILFKLSLGLSATRPQLSYFSTLVSYRHTANESDLKLTREEEFFAASLFEHVATYTLAVQIDTALAAVYPSRFESSDKDVRCAVWVSRLIRNAFAHNPFAPEWKIYSECESKHYEVQDIISLDTTGLGGKYVERRHYGGPLALLRLAQFVRERLAP